MTIVVAVGRSALLGVVAGLLPFIGVVAGPALGMIRLLPFRWDGKLILMMH